MKENQTTTNRNYEVDDGTGVIQVRIWIESDDSSDHIARQLGNVGYECSHHTHHNTSTAQHPHHLSLIFFSLPLSPQKKGLVDMLEWWDS